MHAVSATALLRPCKPRWPNQPPKDVMPLSPQAPSRLPASMGSQARHARMPAPVSPHRTSGAAGRRWQDLAKRGLIAGAAALAACGGGAEKESSANADVVIYGACGNTPNYFSSIRHTRWARFPLTIGIDLTNAPRLNEGRNAEIYLRAIQAGARGWAIGGGIGEVGFVLGREADIVIEFSTALPPNVLGQAFTWPLGQYQRKGVIVALNWQSFSNLATTVVFESAVRQVVLHEIGHALFAVGGNGGHSPFPDDVMSVGGNEYDLPRPRDINTIREAYCRRI